MLLTCAPMTRGEVGGTLNQSLTLPLPDPRLATRFSLPTSGRASDISMRDTRICAVGKATKPRAGYGMPSATFLSFVSDIGSQAKITRCIPRMLPLDESESRHVALLTGRWRGPFLAAGRAVKAYRPRCCDGIALCSWPGLRRGLTSASVSGGEVLK